MRRFLPVLAALLVSSSAVRADWVEQTLEEAEKEAKSKGKLMMVFIYSKTCHVCKGMEEKMWPNIAIQTELENWVAVRVDSAVAVQSKWRWKIDDVPQLRVIDPEGGVFREVTRPQLPGGGTKVEAMLDFLLEVRAAWDQELASRVFEWEASQSEAKAKAKDRQRPTLWFLTDNVATAELALKYPVFLDKTVTVPSKKFVCVAAGDKDTAARFGSPSLPHFIFTDLDGKELGRCGMGTAQELALAMDNAQKKFEDSLIIDPAKALERDLALYEAALRTDREQDKIDLAQKLMDTKDAKVLKPLAKGFNDPSVKLKELLITAMITLDQKNGLPLLLTWVVKETNNKLAVKGWDAVGVTGDTRAVPALEDQILDAPSVEVTVARIKALGNMKDKQVVEFLIDLPFKTKTKGRGPGGGGGVRDAIKNSLNRLTGQDFGDDWVAWKKWWRDNQKGFKFAG